MKARLRFVLYHLLRPFVVVKEYEYESVRENYIESISVPLYGCVAFRRSDGTLQFSATGW